MIAASDEALIEALLREPRSEALIAETYRRFLPFMTRVAGQIMREYPGRAGDVAHEALARVLLRGSLAALKQTAQVRRYLATVAERAALDFLRAAGRELPMDVGALVQASASVALENTAAQEDMTQRLNDVLSRVSSEEYAILKLRFLDDMPLSEIAKQLQITYAAAGQRLSRALKHARKIAESQEDQAQDEFYRWLRQKQRGPGV